MHPTVICDMVKLDWLPWQHPRSTSMVLLEILQYVERQQHHDSSHTGHDVPSKTICTELEDSFKKVPQTSSSSASTDLFLLSLS
jgi:hypothetical protein